MACSISRQLCLFLFLSATGIGIVGCPDKMEPEAESEAEPEGEGETPASSEGEGETPASSEGEGEPQPWLSTESVLFTDSLGIVVHYPTDPEMPQFLGEGIFAAGRTTQDWLVVYPRDGEGGHAYDWTFFDEINEILADADMEAYGWVGYGHPDFMQDPEVALDYDAFYWRYFDEDVVRSFYPPSLDAWRQYCHDLAERGHGQIRVWDIWNEPGAEYWQGTDEELAELFVAAVEEIKAVDPAARILLPEAAAIDLRETFRWAEDAGLAQYADILDIHCYRDYPEADMGLFKQLRDYAQSRSLPIWCSEIGWSALTEAGLERAPTLGVLGNEVQAVNYVKNAVLLYAAGCERHYWYDLFTDGTDPDEYEHNFGMLIADPMREKPVAGAARVLSQQLAGFHYLGWHDLGNREVYLLVFEDGGEYRAVAWHFDPAANQKAYEGHALLPLDVAAIAAGPVVDLSGEQVAVGGLQLGRSPVYIHNVKRDLAQAASLNHGKIQYIPKYRGGTDTEAWISFTPQAGEEGIHMVTVDEDAIKLFETDGPFSYARTDIANEMYYVEFDVCPAVASHIAGRYDLELIIDFAPARRAGAEFEITYDAEDEHYLTTDPIPISHNPAAYDATSPEYFQVTVRLEDAQFDTVWGWDFRLGAIGTDDLRVHEIRVRQVKGR